MTALATITRLQELHATVAGVTSAPAPAAYPGSLQAANLPCILTLPAEGSWNMEGITAPKRADTIYRVYAYVAAIMQGTPVAEGTALVLAIFDALRELYLDPANVQLINGGGVQATLKLAASNPIRHSPVGVLSYGEKDYRGFTVDVGVMEKW